MILQACSSDRAILRLMSQPESLNDLRSNAEAIYYRIFLEIVNELAQTSKERQFISAL